MKPKSPDCSVEVVDDTTMLLSWAMAGDAKKTILVKAITSMRVERNLIEYFQAVVIKILDAARYILLSLVLLGLIYTEAQTFSVELNCVNLFYSSYYFYRRVFLLSRLLSLLLPT